MINAPDTKQSSNVKCFTHCNKETVVVVRIYGDMTRNNRNEIVKIVPPEAIYPDDADFITMILKRKERLKSSVKEILLRANLKANESKTEETVLERKNKGERCISIISGGLKLTLTEDTEEWRNTKKLGSMIGVSEDIRRRKQLATAALIKMNNIWIRKDKIKQCFRLKSYKSLVKQNENLVVTKNLCGF